MSSEPCSVCATTNFKYRCPSCRATSCSLTCFKEHRGQCVQDIDHQPRTGTATTAATPETPDLPAADMLLQDPRLPKLFERYPLLRPKLKSIFEVAVDESHDIAPAERNSRASKPAKSAQQRIARSLRRLEHEVGSEHAERIGLKAFADLVADLSSRRSDQR